MPPIITSGQTDGAAGKFGPDRLKAAINSDMSALNQTNRATNRATKSVKYNVQQ